MSKAKITEEMLKEKDIPILEISKLTFDRKNMIAISGFGKFYQGNYNNEHISLKVVDITLDQEIINEFILWKKNQNNECFLKLKGVILYYNEAYIIFQDNFNETLENLLEQRKLNNIQKIMIAKQILNILNLLKQEKDLTMDLRPGTLIINSENKVKLIDFGMMVNLPKFINEEEIKSIRIKYSPPEYILQNIIDPSYDIYSFGCILIDLFAKNLQQTIFIENKTYEEYFSEIKENKFPSIPNNINCLLYEIISKCLNKNCENRIKIDELSYNLKILLDYLKEDEEKIPLNKGVINNKDEIKDNNFIEDEGFKFKEIYNYAKKINQETTVTFNHINSQLQEKILVMKSDLLNEFDNAKKELEINYKLIKDKIDVIVNTNIKLIKSFYDKIIQNIFQMQDLQGTAMNDLLDIQNNVNGIQNDLLIFNKFKNKDNYENIKNFIENSKNDVDKIIKKYSNVENFDIIKISCDSCSNLVKNYISISKEFILDLKNGLEYLCKIKGFNNNENKKIEQLGDEFLIQKIINNVMLPKNDEQQNENQEEDINNEIENEDNEENNEITEENKSENDEYLITSMTENIICKVVENTNMITIFNYYTKKIKNYFVTTNENENNFKFNSNNFSLYDKENNCIFISGGLKDKKDKNSHDKSLIRINIKLNINNKNNDKNIEDKNIFNDINIIKDNKIQDYIFEIENLSPMNNNRSCHSMIQLSTNKNILLCIGGINTETCEIYNIEYDSWEAESIQELPVICQSPGVIDYNKFIYVFPYSNQFNTIYKLKMGNTDLFWENIKYSINEGKIRKGISVISDGNNIYLFGGYDNDDIYSNIYQVNFDNEDLIDIKSSIELVLPSKCYFNSNYIEINIHPKNNNDEIIDNNIIENNNDKILLFDNKNCVIEFDWISGNFKYYLD